MIPLHAFIATTVIAVISFVIGGFAMTTRHVGKCRDGEKKPKWFLQELEFARLTERNDTRREKDREFQKILRQRDIADGKGEYRINDHGEIQYFAKEESSAD